MLYQGAGYRDARYVHGCREATFAKVSVLLSDISDYRWLVAEWHYSSIITLLFDALQNVNEMDYRKVRE
jgi:hypothetical protein